MDVGRFLFAMNVTPRLLALGLLVFLPLLDAREPQTSPPPAQQTIRARALGVPFDGTPGELNAITDVAGVEVGCWLARRLNYTRIG